MAYARIQPLPDDVLGVDELRGLIHVWRRQKLRIEASGGLHDFLIRLKRDWAIETGVIERLYDWDRGVTETLIEQGISASLISHQSGLDREQAEAANQLIADQLEVVEGLFEIVKGERPLTQFLIRGLHQQFTRHQPDTEAVTPEGQIVRISLVRGAYKLRPNNPRRPDGEMHEYCPPELVDEEMGRLVEWYQAMGDEIPPEVKAAWLHHRFTQIHPFQDGNGRVARALASLVFLTAGVFPLVIRKLDVEYIPALERADSGVLGALVRLFAGRQRDSILAALACESEARRDPSVDAIDAVDSIIESTVELLGRRVRPHEPELERVFETAKRLREMATGELGTVASRLDAAVRAVAPPEAKWGAYVDTASAGEPQSRWFYEQIIAIAGQLRYWPNIEEHRAWVRLEIQTDDPFDFVLAFHGHGRVFQGVLVASAFTFRRIRGEDETSAVVDLAPAHELFQFNDVEPADLAERRFEDWLRAAITTGLGAWRQSVQG